MDKRFTPTTKKLKKAREEGQIPRSQHFINLATTSSGLLLFYFTRYTVIEIYYSLSLDFLHQNHPSALIKLALIFCGLLFFQVLITLILTSLSGGFPPLVPKKIFRFEKLNFIIGLKNIFYEDGSFIFKPILTSIIRSFFILFFGSCLLINFYFETALTSALNLIYILFFWALIENLVAKFFFNKKMMMDLEELKKEFRESDGDPEVKAHQRASARELMSTDIRAEVRRAKVIIVGRN